jgi:amidase
MQPPTIITILAFLAIGLMPARASNAAESVSGHWLVNADFHGTAIYGRMELEQHGQKLTGQLFGEKLEGSLDDSAIHFIAKDKSGGTRQVDGSLKSGVLAGTVVDTDAANESHPDHFSFTATLIRREPRSASVRRELVPSVFYRAFSAANKAVLTVNPGDSIHTTTVDAAGVDKDGHARIMGGNPQTGPFYIQSAIPGDTLVVHLTHLRLNRDYAISDDALVGRALDQGLAVKMKDVGESVVWHLDLA